MRILFVYTNVNGAHADAYAFGMASVMSYVRGQGHEISFVQVNEKSEYPRVFDAVKTFEPRVVGFTSVSSQFHVVGEIAAGVKKSAPQVVAVCGGVHPTISPECLFEAPFLDGILIGESERSFAEFLQLIERGDSYLTCDNFAYVKDGRLVRNPLKPLIKDLDALPYPDKTTYPYGETIQALGDAPFLFSRGCPFRCTYCSNQALGQAYGMHNNLVRYRSPESSIREIEETLDAFPSVKRVSIGDDIFCMNPKWRTEFLKLYKERVKHKFVCVMRADTVTETVAMQLAEAGCDHVTFGVESGNDYIRNVVMNRGMDEATLIRAFRSVQKYGIKTCSLNIIGVPGETEEMIWDTIRLNRKLKPTVTGANIFYPYKGTPLGDQCFAKGLVNEAEYGTFTLERRTTVLNFPEEHKRKLEYYRKNWFTLVYRYDLRRRLKKILFDRFYGTPVWPFLWTARRLAVQAQGMLKASRKGGTL